MVVVRVKLSPDVDKLADVIFGWVQNVCKRLCLGFCITGGFVPVCLRIA